MATIEEYINKAYDLSRGRTQSSGSAMATQAGSAAARNTSALGLAGPIAQKLREAAINNANKTTSDTLIQNEIARNQALAAGQQFDITRQDALKAQEQNREDMAKLGEQQMWSGIWSGLGSLLGGVASKAATAGTAGAV